KCGGSELKSTVRDYSLSYSRWKASSKILSDPGSSDLARQLSQVPTKMVTRQWMYPLSLHCRNAISSVRLVTRPRLQISQMVASAPAAIARSPSASPKPGQSARYVLRGCVSYLTHPERDLRSADKCVRKEGREPRLRRRAQAMSLAILLASI